MTPLVQLVHLSDLHVGLGPTPPRALRTLKLARQLNQQVPGCFEMFSDGMGIWDVQSFARIGRALRDYKVITEWPTATWFVVTGDLTTFGDRPSLETALARVEKTLAVGHRVVSLRGNHDTWPGDAPWLATTAELERQRRRLDRLLPTPARGLPADELSRLAAVQLFATNTARLDSHLNIFAIGHARDANELTASMEDDDLNRPTFRIVLTHHPIDFPAKTKPWHRLQLGDRRNLRKSIRDPHVHLLLSGHTHREWPRLGCLSQPVVDKGDGGTDANQLQLVVGTAAQGIGRDRSSPRRQQFQVVRVHAVEDDHEVTGFKLERTLFQRAPRGVFMRNKPESVNFSV